MKNHTRKQPKGMTLLELTVVILVLIALVSVLFIGTRAWVRGSHKASCIINIRNVQQAARSYQNLNGLPYGASVNPSVDLIGSGKFVETAPVCPGGGTYTYATTIPSVGTLAMTCSLATSEEHAPISYTGW